MIKKIFFVSILTFTIVLFNSCIDEIEFSDQAELTLFKIPDQSGKSGYSSIEFSITAPTETSPGLITNTTQFPYNSTQDSLIPAFTASTNSQVYWATQYQTSAGEVRDTIITVVSYSTKINFSSDVTFFVIAQDGVTISEYKIVINADPINPTGIAWAVNEISESIFNDTKSYRFDGKTWLISGELNEATNEATTILLSSVDGTGWTKETIDSENFPMGIKHTIAEFNGKLYSLGHLSIAADGMLVGKNEIWESEDGITWTMTGTLPGEGVIFRSAAVLDGKLYVYGGTGITENYSLSNDEFEAPSRSIHIYNGSSWTTASQTLPVDMPVRYGASAVHYNKLFYVGGQKETGICADQWVSQNGTYWIKVADDILQPIINASLIDYDHRLWLVGGEVSSNTDQKVLESKSEGNFWVSIDSIPEDETVLPTEFITRAGHSAFVDENSMVWIIGGYHLQNNDMSILSDVWTGQMNKFK